MINNACLEPSHAENALRRAQNLLVTAGSIEVINGGYLVKSQSNPGKRHAVDLKGPFPICGNPLCESNCKKNKGKPGFCSHILACLLKAGYDTSTWLDLLKTASGKQRKRSKTQEALTPLIDKTIHRSHSTRPGRKDGTRKKTRKAIPPSQFSPDPPVRTPMAIGSSSTSTKDAFIASTPLKTPPGFKSLQQEQKEQQQQHQQITPTAMSTDSSPNGNSGDDCGIEEDSPYQEQQQQAETSSSDDEEFVLVNKKRANKNNNKKTPSKHVGKNNAIQTTAAANDVDNLSFSSSSSLVTKDAPTITTTVFHRVGDRFVPVDDGTATNKTILTLGNLSVPITSANTVPASLLATTVSLLSVSSSSSPSFPIEDAGNSVEEEKLEDDDNNEKPKTMRKINPMKPQIGKNKRKQAPELNSHYDIIDEQIMVNKKPRTNNELPTVTHQRPVRGGNKSIGTSYKEISLLIRQNETVLKPTANTTGGQNNKPQQNGSSNNNNNSDIGHGDEDNNDDYDTHRKVVRHRKPAANTWTYDAMGATFGALPSCRTCGHVLPRDKPRVTYNYRFSVKSDKYTGNGRMSHYYYCPQPACILNATKPSFEPGTPIELHWALTVELEEQYAVLVAQL
jgi:hypothetical protein